MHVQVLPIPEFTLGPHGAKDLVLIEEHNLPQHIHSHFTTLSALQPPQNKRKFGGLVDAKMEEKRALAVRGETCGNGEPQVKNKFTFNTVRYFCHYCLTISPFHMLFAECGARYCKQR